MRLVLIDADFKITADYGPFAEAEAEGFFQEALSAIEFRKQFPDMIVHNELQLRMLTDTFAKMGMLHGNPDAIQDWMRPYITNEINRLAQRESLYQRTKETLANYKEKAWDWIKSELFAGASNLFRKIFKLPTK